MRFVRAEVQEGGIGMNERPFHPADADWHATNDWNEQKAAHLGVGTVDLDRPHYNPVYTFYERILGSVVTNELEQFVFLYNRKVKSLLLKHGIPPWAPARRLLAATTCLESMRDSGQEISKFSLLSTAEEKAISYLMGRWQPHLPILWCRIPSLQLLLFGGVAKDQFVAVDVIDTLNDVRWMAHYNYPEDEYGKLPWLEKQTERKREGGSLDLFLSPTAPGLT